MSLAIDSLETLKFFMAPVSAREEVHNVQNGVDWREVEGGISFFNFQVQESSVLEVISQWSDT